MPQMRQPQEPTGLWPFLRQDLKKELRLSPNIEGAVQLSKPSRLLAKGAGVMVGVYGSLSALFFLSVWTGSCGHCPDTLPESVKVSQVFDIDERIIIRVISRVLKNRGFATSEWGGTGAVWKRDTWSRGD